MAYKLSNIILLLIIIGGSLTLISVSLNICNTCNEEPINNDTSHLTLVLAYQNGTPVEKHNISFIFNDASNWTNNTPMNITTAQTKYTHVELNCSGVWWNNTPMNVTPSFTNYFYIISNGNHSEVYFVESCHTG